MNKLEFIKNKVGNNEVISFDDFYISYNPKASINKEELKQQAIENGALHIVELLDILPDGFLDGDRGEETALIKNLEFYILNGDYRKEYLEALEKSDNDFEYCLYSVFGKYSESNKSSWSTEIGREKTSEEIKNWLRQRKLI